MRIILSTHLDESQRCYDIFESVNRLRQAFCQRLCSIERTRSLKMHSRPVVHPHFDRQLISFLQDKYGAKERSLG